MSANRPKPWSQTTLGKALPIRYGKARTDKAGVVREDSPVYGSSGVIDKFDRALTTGPALVIGRKGNVGATHYSSEPCWPIDTVYFAEASEEKDLRFFKYLLDHLQLGRMDRSTAVPGLSRDDYNSKEVSIPDIGEQRAIVAEIEKQFTRLEAGMGALRRAQAHLKRYRAAVLKAACEGQLVSGNSRYWKHTTLENVCAKVTDGDHQPPPKVSAGIPFLTIGNISSGRLDFSDTRFVPEGYFSRIKADRVPKINDVLYSVVGATIGIPVLVTTDQRFCFQRHIALLRPSAAILPTFLWLFMASPDTFRSAWAKTTGSAQPTLPLKRLRSLSIALPPLADQTRIVAEVERRLTVLKELDAAVSANLRRAIRLRQALLQEAFNGGMSIDSNATGSKLSRALIPI